MQNPIPSIGLHRGVPLHNHQDEARLAIVRADIDDVYTLQGRTAALARFADDPRRAPEARAFAAELALSDIRRAADRRRARRVTVEPEVLEMHAIGCSCETWRCETHYCSSTESFNPTKGREPVERDRPLPSLEERLAARDRFEGSA